MQRVHREPTEVQQEVEYLLGRYDLPVAIEVAKQNYKNAKGFNGKLKWSTVVVELFQK